MTTIRQLNPHDRSRRNMEIVRARAEGDSWATLGHRFGVSARQARRIVKDVGSAIVTDTTAISPIDIIDAAIMRCEANIEHLAEIAASTDDPIVTIKAIGSQVRITEHELELLQNIGVLPTPLSNLAQQIDLRRVAQQAVDVLNRHHVPAAAKMDFLAALKADS